jgi:hypothetical protein
VFSDQSIEACMQCDNQVYYSGLIGRGGQLRDAVGDPDPGLAGQRRHQLGDVQRVAGRLADRGQKMRAPTSLLASASTSASRQRS